MDPSSLDGLIKKGDILLRQDGPEWHDALEEL